MEFIRKKKRGQNRRVQRMWLSQEGYRITWRKEVCGVPVPARYHACVRVIVPNYRGAEGEVHQMWDFVNRRHRLYKTLKAAQDDCERHKRLWTKACEATGVRALTEILGKLPDEFPVWVRGKMDRKAFAVLVAPFTRKKEACPEPSPSDPTGVSESSAPNTSLSLQETPTSGPASAAGEQGDTPTGQREGISASPATEAAKAPAKRPSRSTAKSSKHGGRRESSTTTSSKSARKPSKGSRAKKSKPSAC